MKKVILILIATLGFIACENKEVSKIESVSDKEVVKDTVEAKIEWNNPARMGGNTNFGAFFITMLRHREYDMAVLFTAKGSIEKFGKDKIKEVYANFPYDYTLHLADSKLKNDTITLSFSTNEYATGKLKHMTGVVENDTFKLVLPDKPDKLLK